MDYFSSSFQQKTGNTLTSVMTVRDEVRRFYHDFCHDCVKERERERERERENERVGICTGLVVKIRVECRDRKMCVSGDGGRLKALST